MARPTITDIAREAGVGASTVDRVINGRVKVRESTQLRVLEAARKLGYHAVNLMEQRIMSQIPEVKVGIVLHKEKQSFYRALAEAITLAARDTRNARVKLEIAYSSSQSPQDFIEKMEAVGSRSDVLAATAITDRLITDKVADLQREGVPVLALLNDFAQGIRATYVGLNNMKVGRIAGWMIAKAVQSEGEIAVFIGGHRWHGHELRETGFRSYLRENASFLKVRDTLVNLETRQLTYEATCDLLERHSKLKGMYIAGGGMEGAIQAVRELREPNDVCLVVNELTPESQSALVDGYVDLAISTPLDVLARDLIRLMIDAKLESLGGFSGLHFLKPEICISESII